MILIHTCELNGAIPFDYLTELQKHVEELAQSPAAWMPWKYRETLGRDDTNRGCRVGRAYSSMMNPTWPETIGFGPC